jgi:peptide/nickel transport system permease protein
MTSYILKRLLLMPVMVLGITMLSFVIIVLAPGTSGALGGATGEVKSGRISQQQLEIMQQTFHAFEPVHKRYLYWLGVLQPTPYPSEYRDWKKHVARLKTDALSERERKLGLTLAGTRDQGRRIGLEREQADAATERLKLENYITALNRQGMSAQSFRDEGKPLPEEWNALDQEIRDQVQVPLRGMLFLDFGVSVTQPSVRVWDMLKSALPITILMNIICFFVIYLVSIPLGIYGARHHNAWQDQGLTVLLFILYSLPSFWVALLLIRLMLYLPEGLKLPYQGILPTGADDLPTLTYLWEGTKHLALPILCSCYGGLASLSRYMRVGMLDSIHADYVRTARAKGCPERTIIWKHALRNSLIPIVTMFGGLLPGLIGGSFIIESIFSIPGMGLLGYKALLTRDFTVLMADFTIGAILVMLGILVSDILYVIVDPRIAFEEAR